MEAIDLTQDTAEEDAVPESEEFPDIHELYAFYNHLYFDNKLGACSVSWSSGRMTLCGGTCESSKAGGCHVKLSKPLLKFRPASDLKWVLLHELIHAYCFLVYNYNDHDGHGKPFLDKMREINESQLPDPYRPPGGYKISVLHNFSDEVDHYRVHHWRCEKCGLLIKRAMNRPPSEKDCRAYRKDASQMRPCVDQKCPHHSHVKCCGGAFEKIAGPEPKQAKGKKRPGAAAGGNLAKFFKAEGNGSGSSSGNGGDGGSSGGGSSARRGGSGSGSSSGGTHGGGMSNLGSATSSGGKLKADEPHESVGASRTDDPVVARELRRRAAEARAAGAALGSGSSVIISTAQGQEERDKGAAPLPPLGGVAAAEEESEEEVELVELVEQEVTTMVACPVCSKELEDDVRVINEHIDACVAA